MNSLRSILKSSSEYKGFTKNTVDPKEDDVDKSRSKWDNVYWVDDIELLEDVGYDINQYHARGGGITTTEPVGLKENRPEPVSVDDRESLILSDVYELVDGDKDIVSEEKVALKRLQKGKSLSTRQKALVVDSFTSIRKLLTLYGVGINNEIKTQDIPVVLEVLDRVERKLWGVL